jgi:hypothetical protein
MNAPMKSRVSLLLSLLLLAVSAAFAVVDGLSEIPEAHRQDLVVSIDSYAAAYKDRNWTKLYELVSSVGRGGVQKTEFVDAMKAEHGNSSAQMPDLLSFIPRKGVKASDGFDIYGCGKAEREGMKFIGIAVVHTVFEQDKWKFTGWSFTDFPNLPCKVLDQKDWKPDGEMEFGQAMKEIRDYRQHSGTPFHVDSPK